MSIIRRRLAAASAASLTLTATVTACAGPTAMPAAGSPVILIGPTQRPSVLVVLLSNSTAASGLARSMLLISARPGEHLTILSLTSGAVLSSGRAPQPPRLRLPGPPVRPADATTFELASYRHARARYAARLRHDRIVLRTREETRLRDWVSHEVAHAAAAALGGSQAGPSASIPAALAAISGWREAGVRAGNRQVLAIIGMSQLPAIVRQAHVDLSGDSLVVADDEGSGGSEAALQAALVQAGAGSAVVLGAASAGEIAAVVSRDLTATISYPLARVRFGPGKSGLPAMAGPGLRALLHLLIVMYPHATATVNGYTDNLPVPGGNTELSWRRARAVVAWLIRHGISAGRLRAVGHGAAFPQAPNQPGGQAENRRVVVVIEPAR